MIIKRKWTKNCKEFIPRNSEKYIGKYPIITRSGWEYKFCQWLDANPDILCWSSESVSIRYIDPITRRSRRYYPDFFMETAEGGRFIVEIKPYKETIPPKRTRRKSKKTIMTEDRNYSRNQAKFRAAENFCRKMGYTFKVITEKELFGK